MDEMIGLRRLGSVLEELEVSDAALLSKIEGGLRCGSRVTGPRKAGGPLPLPYGPWLTYLSEGEEPSPVRKISYGKDFVG